MNLKFFQIPAHGGEAEAELNRFLGGHRIVNIDRHLVADGAESFWAVCVSYVESEGVKAPARKNKIDYREVLSEKDFALYVKLRTLRKELAQREGVPVYAVFTNEQLAAMVQQGVTTRAQLASIEGIGEARVSKYADQFLKILNEGAAAPNEGAK